MKQKIVLDDRETRSKIAKAFNVTPQNVSQALNFSRNSDRAKKIRAMARRMGGKLLKEVEE